MDAQPRLRSVEDIRHDVGEAVGQHAAVGVAQDDDIGSGSSGSPNDLDGVGRVGAVPVEEVLGVQEDPPPLSGQVRDRVADHHQVLFESRPKRFAHMSHVAFGNEADDRRLGLTQRRHLRVVGRHRVRTPGRAEGGERRMLKVQLGLCPPKELLILRVGARPPPFDEPDPQVVEVACDRQLVVNG